MKQLIDWLTGVQEDIKRLLNPAVAILIALLFFAVTAGAQNFTFQSFLNQKYLCSTNGANISNIMSFKYPLNMSNVAGIIYTTRPGVTNRIVNASDYTMLLQDVSLYTERGGLPILQQVGTHAGLGISGAAGMASNYISGQTLFVRARSGSGVNGDVTIVIQPVWDGTNAAISTGDDFSCVFDTTASGYNTLATNLPVWRWPGCSKLRVKSIINANSAAAGDCWIEQLGVGGFVP